MRLCIMYSLMRLCNLKLDIIIGQEYGRTIKAAKYTVAVELGKK